MVKRSKGFLSRSRKFLTKNPRERGLPGVSRFLREFKIGEKIHIDVEPAVRRGMPHRRFQGKTGIIVGRRGKAYLVDVKIGTKVKHLIIHPVHLKPVRISGYNK